MVTVVSTMSSNKTHENGKTNCVESKMSTTSANLPVLYAIEETRVNRGHGETSVKDVKRLSPDEVKRADSIAETAA